MNRVAGSFWVFLNCLTSDDKFPPRLSAGVLFVP